VPTVERLFVHVADARHVVGGDEILLPQLAPVVVVPDDVALRAVGGQQLGDLRHEDRVGDDGRIDVDAGLLRPFLDDLDVGLHDRMSAMADGERLRRLRGRGERAQRQ
jgi:hypothetical protein